MEIICPFKTIFGIRTKTIYDLLKKQEENGKSFFFKHGFDSFRSCWLKSGMSNQRSELWWVGDYILMIYDITESNKKPSEHVYHVNTILLSDGLW